MCLRLSFTLLRTSAWQLRIAMLLCWCCGVCRVLGVVGRWRWPMALWGILLRAQSEGRILDGRLREHCEFIRCLKCRVRITIEDLQLLTSNRTGPALGPIIGGVLSETLGWRAIFWFLVIFSGIYLVTFVLFCPETGRNVVGNGSIPPPSWNMSLLNWMKTRKEALASVGVDEQETRQVKLRAQADLTSKRTLRVPNPLGTLLIMVEKDVAVILLFNTLV